MSQRAPKYPVVSMIFATAGSTSSFQEGSPEQILERTSSLE
jgi:hypothetical protein